MVSPSCVLSAFALVAGVFLSELHPHPIAQDYPAIQLRAYGTLSATYKPIPGEPMASVLDISCDSNEKAKLVLAKYLSDLAELGGVTPSSLTTSCGPVIARELNAQQGAIAAIRSGSQVYLLTAADGAALTSVIENEFPRDAKIDASDAEISVPMYVDRWDKYGFRFYYCPLWKPDGAVTYDLNQDFKFAQDSRDSGIVLWVSPQNQPLADGVLDFTSNAWIYQSARERKLPLGINLGFGDTIGYMRMHMPGDLAPRAPGYNGGWYGATNFGVGDTVAWTADAAQDVILGQLKPLVQKLDSEDAVVNWLEPHEEMGRGIAERLEDHGPTAETNFKLFLQEKYHTPQAVAARWQEPGAFHDWSEVPFPEVATFCGWNKDAIDLHGEWKVSYDAPYGADSARPDLDDSQWGSMQAPGNALILSLPHKPAVFRRGIDIDPAWHKAHPKVWLTCFDFNSTRLANAPNFLLFVNGKPIPENPPRKTETHWCTLDVSDALVDGHNVITLCLPQALMTYRIFLSGTAPASYPSLGPQLNAMWADFTDWTAWSRGRSVRRGMQMIRQVDPDRPITLMTPDADMAPIKQAAEDYGGIVHDTGGMAGGWNDIQPAVAESSGLPTDCEPGSPAVDLNDFKRFMGRWETEGTCGIDYFQHLGQVEWKPEIKDYFEKTQNLWHLIGKYHVPVADFAVLDSDRVDRLMGFPWDGDQVVPNLVDDIRLWPLMERLSEEYPRGALIEQDFANRHADKFRVILDSGTTVLDPETIDAITGWVKRGGIFITSRQTGRHTSVLENAWPISKLTGYAVTAVDAMPAPDAQDNTVPQRTLHAVSGQRVFDSSAPEWPRIAKSAGLSLKKIDPTCEDLLQWDDGSIAAGMRKLGQGAVINLGSYSSALPEQVLNWLNVRPLPIVSSDSSVRVQHYISNNGLYDVWSTWNQKDSPVTATLTFRDGYKPTTCRDVNTGADIPVDSDANGARLSNVAYTPWETHVYLTPRGQLASSALEWFKLQRGWWQGTADPGKPVPVYQSKVCLDLTDGWACKIIPGPITGTPPENASLADPALDDSTWPRVPFCLFNVPDNATSQHAFLRRTFTVPQNWTGGSVRLFARLDGPGAFREYLDGNPYAAPSPSDDCGGIFKPGSKHCLVVESWSQNGPAGPSLPVFLSYRPDPVAVQKLDNWSYAPDCLKFAAPAPLPVTTPAGGALRAVVNVPAAQATRSAFIHIDQPCDDVIVNGHSTRGGYSNIYAYFDANVTPWINFGADNTVLLVFHDHAQLANPRLEFYDQSRYP